MPKIMYDDKNYSSSIKIEDELSTEINNYIDIKVDVLVEDINTIEESIYKIEENLDEYFSEIRVTDTQIVLKSGNIKNSEGVYNTYTYDIERDTNGRIINFVDSKNRETNVIRE